MIQEKPIIGIASKKALEKRLNETGGIKDRFTRSYETDETIFNFSLQRIIPHIYATSPVIIEFELFSRLERKDKKSGKSESYLLYLGFGFQESLRSQTPFANQFVEDISPELYDMMIDTYTSGTRKILVSK